MTSHKPDDQAIFEVVRKIDSAETRHARLQQLCGDDAATRERIEALLRAYDESRSFLESPPPALAATFVEAPPSEVEGTMIGPYKLREQLGEGGMGIVYVAEQEQPVRRKVALKLIKPGMDTREVIARFEAERQALALMEHPNIARVLDAGTVGQAFQPDADDTGDVEGQSRQAGKPDLRTGRPYFVMELVRGVPITDYCDQAHVGLRERLALFVKVCQAVQHAHQKGVIHRDLKPSNVLVTLHDGVPVPKVIDFGVAKAINQRLTEHTVYTRHAQMVGTPLYMSPEQAELSGLDVDTRSDVYSLGVLLYELLTGTTPFDKETFSKVGFDEMRRMIREEEPHRPSQRISTLTAEKMTTISQKRGLDPRKVADTLRGELDWVAMKALEKDRRRRYESASALAADVERYLADEPVEACPPSAIYRMRKFARRRRGLLTAALLLTLSILTGAAASVWQAVEATRARKRAEAGLQIAMDGVDRTVRSLVDQRWIPVLRGTHKKSIEESLTLFNRLIELKRGDPQIYILRGQVHEALTRPDEAVADYTAAIELDPANHRAHYRLANFFLSYQMLPKRDFTKATEHIRRAVELAPDVLDYKLERARITARIDYPASIPLFEEVVRLNPRHSLTYSTRADEEAEHGDFRAALDDAVKALELDSENYEGHRMLGRALCGLGRFEEAIAAFDTAKALAPFQHFIYRFRGECLLKMKAYEEAVKDFTAGWQLAPDYSVYGTRLAAAHFALSKYREALADLARSVDSNPGDTWSVVSIPPETVAACPDESFRAGMLALADRTIELTNGKPEAYLARAALRSALKDFDAAQRDCESAVALLKKARANGQTRVGDVQYAGILADLGSLLLHQQKPVDAEPILRECLLIREKIQPDVWTTFNAKSLLGASLLEQKKYAEAEPLLVTGYEGMQDRAEMITATVKVLRLTQALERLVQLYEAWDQPAHAAQWKAKLDEMKTANAPETKKE